MAKAVKGVKGSVLRWARESQGYSVEDVAARMGREPEEIRNWENEADAPTYVQLEKLAYRVFRRPLAVFFLPAPPEEPNLKPEFRTLPDIEIDRLGADTRYHLRLARAFQIALYELNDGSNRADTKIFKDIALSVDSNVVEVASTIRNYLGDSRSERSSWSGVDEALRQWRSRVEEHGVYIFKNSFREKDVSGFSLVDDEFPIIYLNNSTAKSRQIFSLFHELSHILLHTNSITKLDDSYIQQLPRTERRIEMFCNSLAAEVLLPSGDFAAQLARISTIDESSVVGLAMRYRVSREVVLRRLLDLGLVTSDYYEEKAQEWAQQAEETGPSGGNYYTTQATYLGDNYLRLVFSRLYQGRITLEQAAEYLGVRTGNVGGLEAVGVGKQVEP